MRSEWAGFGLGAIALVALLAANGAGQEPGAGGPPGELRGKVPDMVPSPLAKPVLRPRTADLSGLVSDRSLAARLAETERPILDEQEYDRLRQRRIDHYANRSGGQWGVNAHSRVVASSEVSLDEASRAGRRAAPVGPQEEEGTTRTELAITAAILFSALVATWWSRRNG